MGRKTVEGMNFGAYRYLFPVDSDFFFTVDDMTSKRACNRETDKYYTALGTQNIMLQMVSYRSARAHAGAGHDHSPAPDLVDCDGRDFIAGKLKSL